MGQALIGVSHKNKGSIISMILPHFFYVYQHKANKL